MNQAAVAAVPRSASSDFGPKAKIKDQNGLWTVMLLLSAAGNK
ncbi:hypothetical protein [Bradyrhizobium sp. CCBAU 11357]|nr:hypothetical protein [Bradyrhizobium sp. CCBAU 11357]